MDGHIYALVDRCNRILEGKEFPAKGSQKEVVDENGKVRAGAGMFAFPKCQLL